MTRNARHIAPVAKWGLAAALTACAHAGAVSLAIGMGGAHAARGPEPVMIVDLPPPGEVSALATESFAAPAVVQPVSLARQAVPGPEKRTPPPRRTVDVPELETQDTRAADVSAQSPDAPASPAPMLVAASDPDPLVDAEATPQPVAATAAPGEALGEAPAGADSIGDDPRARKEEADYYSRLSAYLNRKKRYPSEAKAAGQQGTVTVRFTVLRDGDVVSASIKASSGHALLDEATLALLREVSPLPAMPSSMRMDSVTISLPIAYALSRK